MKYNNGVTLIELLISMSLLTLIVFSGSSIYLSGMNMSVDAQYSAQANMNAQLVMMHFEKYVRVAATEFDIPNDNTLIFKTYNINFPDFSNDPLVKVKYLFEDDSITFTSEEKGNVETFVFKNIHDCKFETFANDGVVLKVTLETMDNNDTNISKLTSYIKAELTASPSVYTVE